MLTTESVVRMVTGQVPKDIILAKLQSSKSNFDLSTTGLVRLNDSNVSQDIIKVMMMPPPPPSHRRPPRKSRPRRIRRPRKRNRRVDEREMGASA